LFGFHDHRFYINGKADQGSSNKIDQDHGVLRVTNFDPDSGTN
jgi:hypothetical protein